VTTVSWSNDYTARRCSADAAVTQIKSGDTVYHSGNSAMPGALIRALAARRHELASIRLVHMLLLGDYPLAAPGTEETFEHLSLFVGSADRAAVNEGRSDYVPVLLHQIPRLYRERIVPVDVAMIMVSPPDEHGFMSFGVETMASRAACEAARTVIAQVNRFMPRVLGDAFIHVNRVSVIVEHDEPLVSLPERQITETDRQIGLHVRDLIPDGATLQMGIGGIPDAVLDSLAGLKDLGIHSEMISDGAMRAIEAGIVTGTRKTLHPGKVIMTFALGSSTLYEFLDNNALIEAHPCDYVNDPQVIAQNERLVSINSALAIDLTGQVAAESIGTKIYSGFGGQLDFIRGASRSKGGVPVIALPSTAKGASVSRIVPTLPIGAGVVTTRGDIQHVVTEYGVASLFGRSLSERAEALIAIAHPAFRESLAKAWRDRLAPSGAASRCD
jgi:acyl-CoA hydrolase